MRTAHLAYTVRDEECGWTVLLGFELLQEVVRGVEPGHAGKVLVSLGLPHHIVQSMGGLLRVLKFHISVSHQVF